MSSTFTVNLALRKPEHRDSETLESWDSVLNTDFDLIDAAFGLRAYTEQNYIANSDSHSQSLDKLDVQLFDVALLTPTADQKAALIGPVGTPPSGSNPYATVSAMAAYLGALRKVVLFPEYPGGTILATPAVGNVGTLTVGSEQSSNYRFNYISWTSTEAALNSYDIIVQFKIPDTFSGWNTAANKAIIVDFISTTGSSADNGVAIEVQKDGIVTVSSATIQASAAWAAERLGTETLRLDATDPVLASIVAGNILNMRITLSAKSSNVVKLGPITLQYVA